MADKGFFRTVKAFSRRAAILAGALAAAFFASSALFSCSDLNGGYGGTDQGENSSVLVFGDLPAGMGRVCGKIKDRQEQNSTSKTVAPDSSAIATLVDHYDICAWGTPDSGSPVPESSPIHGTVNASTRAFDISLPFGSWTLRADAIDSGDKIILSKKSGQITLSDDNPVISVNFSLDYYAKSDETGKLGLPLSYDTSRITSISYSLDSEPPATGISISDTVDVTGAGGTFNLDGTTNSAFDALPPGTYNLVVEFCDANGVVVRLDQKVQIYSNLTTGKISGSAPYVNSSGQVDVTATVIQKYESSSFYVGGTGASDSNKGTRFDPLLTIKSAMTRIDASSLPAATTEFTIYVQDDVDLAASVSIASGKKIAIVGTKSGSKSAIDGAASYGIAMGGSSLTCKNVTFNKIHGFEISAGQADFANCSITNGVAGSSGNGGGLCVSGPATVTMNNCAVSGCEASYGGAIYAAGQVELKDCLIGAEASEPAQAADTKHSNKATGSGGGIYIAGTGALTLNGSNTISYNYASVRGGGIYFGAGVDFKDCVIKHNLSAQGGGIYAAGGNATMDDTCEIALNVANKESASGNGFGGGIFVGGGSTTFEMNGGKISGNSADKGGGFYTENSSGRVEINDGEISENHAASQGDGIYHKNSTLKINGGKICDNDESGVYIDNPSGGAWVTMTGGQISGHTDCGVRLLEGDGNNFDMSGGKISDNEIGAYVAQAYDSSMGSGFIMSGGAQLVDNCIYLAKDSGGNVAIIRVKAALTSAELPVATIWPEEYSLDKQVISFASSALATSESAKFAVKDDAEGEAWAVVASGNYGVLKQPRSVIYVASPTTTPAGSDTTGTGSRAAPYATIYKAAQAFSSNPEPSGTADEPIFENKIYVLSDLTYTTGAGADYGTACRFEVVGCKGGTVGDNVKLIFNTPDVNDCGFYVAPTHKIKFTNIDITQTDTTTPNDYAAINVDTNASNSGEVWLEDSSIKGMYAKKCSAIAAKGDVHLKNVEISGNKTVAATGGSMTFGPAINSSTGTVSVLGKVVVQNNTVELDDGAGGKVYKEQNLWIGENAGTAVFHPIKIAGVLDGDSQIGVTLFDYGTSYKTFTTGFASSGISDPATVFASDDGMSVVKSSNEATMSPPTTLYVRLGGSDLIGNGSSLLPFATIQKALDKINDLNNASADYTIKVEGVLAAAQHAAADDALKAASLTIMGDSAATSVVSGGLSVSSEPILWLYEVPVPVTIENIGFISGKNSDSTSGGGAILAQSCANITIKDSAFTSCSATIANGGAIYFDGGTLTLSNTSFTGNSSGYNGGAIFVKTGTLEMNSGTIAANTAIGSGGGVSVGSGGTFIMSGGKISGNSAGLTGGGINNSGIVCIYDDAVIGDSSASGTATSETDRSNKADYNGGGICNLGKLALGYKTWTSSATAPSNPQSFDGGVYYNYAQAGGGIFNANSSTLYIASGNISKNMAASTSGNDGGGGINSYGASAKLYMTGGTVSQNNSAHFGGGVLVYSGAAELTGVTISGNTASSNGGGFACVGGTVTMNSGTIGGLGAGNIGAGGAGVYLKKDDAAGTPVFTMKGGEVSYNTVASGGSGGGFMNQYGTLNIQGSAEISNNDGGSNGGGILTFGTTNMTGGTISANTAHNGGGVFVFQNDFAMSDGTISDNTATVNPSAADPSETGHGGGVYVNNLADGATTYLGDFKLSGAAYIPLRTGNDVYLQNSITIEGDLTHAAPAATITPSVYSSGTIVLTEASAGLVADNYGKFAVADDSSGGKWTVNSAGCLAQLGSGGGTITIHTPEGDLNLAASPTTIDTSASDTTVTISATDASGSAITNGLTWNGVTVYYGADEIDTATGNTYKFLKAFPKGTYTLAVSVTYKGTTYSDSFTIKKTVD